MPGSGSDSGSTKEPSRRGASPFDTDQQSITEANRLNRALGLPERSRRQAAETPPVGSTRPARPIPQDPLAPPLRPGQPTADPEIEAPELITPIAQPGTSQPGTGQPGTNGAPAPNFPPGVRGIPLPGARVRPPRRIETKKRVKRSRRTLRHVDPWSVFKVSVLLYICLYVAVMLAGILLWSALLRTGLVEQLESFVAEVGSYAVWEIDGNIIYERARIIGLVMAAAGVALNVMLAILFNLISDLVGGVRVTILEDDNTSPTN